MIELHALDRDVATAKRLVAAFHGELREPDEERVGPPPLASIRKVSRRELHEELGGLATDPWARALRGWVAYLTLERVTARDHLRAAELRHARAHRTERGELVSLDELVESVLLRPREPARAAAELVEAARPLRRAARFASARWVEAASLLEGLDLAALEHPGSTREALGQAAGEMLASTDALRPSAGARPWWELVSEGFGREAGEGWPVAPNARWIEGIFHGSVLVEGLRPSLPPLPRAIGASSFARALACFGRALVDVDLPLGPFAMGRRPFEPLSARRAALFASLVAEPSFHRHVLGLGRSASREQARRAASSLVVHLRHLAARVHAFDAFIELDEDEAMHAHAEATLRALGSSVPGALAGVVLRYPRGLRLEWQGILLGVLDRSALRDQHDEDWWRNPRAHEALRHEHAQPLAAPDTAALPLDGAVPALVAWLDELGVGS